MVESFNPVSYGFRFTPDWYEFPHKKAHKRALVARNKRARQLRAEGYRVRCFAVPGQLITQGGIGTPHPQIEVVVTVYSLVVEGVL